MNGTCSNGRRVPLLLYQQHSTFLKHGRKRAQAACPDTVSPRDPLLAELEAELARYREYFEGLRLQVQRQEYQK
ncbi:hypothetical protein [Ktedonobacter robiniae]|nr:hypothetical protein [Ktedonobacter robiniae]